MGFLKEFIDRKRDRDRRMKDYEDNDRIEDTINDRKMSHNERELIKIMNHERELAIREALYWEEIRRQNEEKLKARNMMKFNQSMFNNENILREKNIFLRGGSW